MSPLRRRILRQARNAARISSADEKRPSEAIARSPTRGLHPFGFRPRANHLEIHRPSTPGGGLDSQWHPGRLRVSAGPRRPRVEAYQWYPEWLGGREAGHVQASGGKQCSPIGRVRRSRHFFHLRRDGAELDQAALRVDIQADHSGVGLGRVVGGNNGRHGEWVFRNRSPPRDTAGSGDTRNRSGAAALSPVAPDRWRASPAAPRSAGNPRRKESRTRDRWAVRCTRGSGSRPAPSVPELPAASGTEFWRADSSCRPALPLSTNPARMSASADADGPHRDAIRVPGRRHHLGRRRFPCRQRRGERVASRQRGRHLQR